MMHYIVGFNHFDIIEIGHRYGIYKRAEICPVVVKSGGQLYLEELLQSDWWRGIELTADSQLLGRISKEALNFLLIRVRVSNVLRIEPHPSLPYKYVFIYAQTANLKL